MTVFHASPLHPDDEDAIRCTGCDTYSPAHERKCRCGLRLVHPLHGNCPPGRVMTKSIADDAIHAAIRHMMDRMGFDPSDDLGGLADMAIGEDPSDTDSGWYAIASTFEGWQFALERTYAQAQEDYREESIKRRASDLVGFLTALYDGGKDDAGGDWKRALEDAKSLADYVNE